MRLCAREGERVPAQRRSSRAAPISETTVKRVVTHILQKLGLRDRVQAVVLAYQTSLMETDAPR
jgi:DNA-binding CsgD family transcriptional regulator